MSTEKHKFEARRWISQAADDLDAAGVLLEGEKYAQACFYAQQAAEKAVKGVGWANGLALWGHSLIKLREQLQEHEVPIQGNDPTNANDNYGFRVVLFVSSPQ
jgi:HEPN domain-containing protein